MAVGFGWKKDRFDKRDLLFKPKLVSLPDEVNLSSIIPNVRDQGGIGSCTGFGIGGNLTAMAKKQGVFTEWFSPWWIYNGARFLEGTLSYDYGAYPRDCLEWLLKKGSLLEHFWPYNDGTYTLDKTSPPSKFDLEAAKYPLLEYVRVTDGSTNICTALSQGYIVSIGIPWYNKWIYTTTGNLAEVTSWDSVAGGHEVYLYGYKMSTNRFIGANSWGIYWGNQGHFTMPFNCFDGLFQQEGGYDAHIIKVNWLGSPIPPVPPEPIQELKVKVSTDSGASWNTFKKE